MSKGATWMSFNDSRMADLGLASRDRLTGWDISRCDPGLSGVVEIWEGGETALIGDRLLWRASRKEPKNWCLKFMLTLYFWVACFLMVRMLVCGYLCLFVKGNNERLCTLSIFTSLTYSIKLLLNVTVLWHSFTQNAILKPWPNNQLIVCNSSHDPLMFFQVIGCVINGSITNLKVQYSNDIWTPDHLASNLFLPFKYN